MIRTLFIALAIAAPAPLAAREATAVVRQFLDDYAAQNLAGIVAASAPDVTMALPFAPGAPKLAGRESCAAYLTEVFGKYRSIALDDIVLTPAAGGRDVTVEAVATFETPAGERHRVGYVWVISVAADRIVASRNYLLPL